jgi:hypothetical protein
MSGSFIHETYKVMWQIDDVYIYWYKAHIVIYSQNVVYTITNPWSTQFLSLLCVTFYPILWSTQYTAYTVEYIYTRTLMWHFQSQSKTTGSTTYHSSHYALVQRLREKAHMQPIWLDGMAVSNSCWRLWQGMFMYTHKTVQAITQHLFIVVKQLQTPSS